MKYKTDYIKIQNLKQFLIPKVKEFHPDDPRHTPYWSKLTKYCVEGLWGKEFGAYRYMPGRLFFYGNFCTILDVDDEQNTRKKIKPKIRDIEWERSYMLLEAEGFSGWSDDDVYTSDIAVYHPDTVKNSKKRYLDLHNKDGRLKIYLEPRENIRKLHDKPMGVPLYHNECKNIVELGARGGGKQLQLDEPVRVVDGWKTIGDIMIGDKVYGSDGSLCTVTNKSIVETYPYYNITLRDGREIEACENHMWKVWSKNAKRYVVKTTKELYGSYFNERIDSKHRVKYNEIKKVKEFKFAIPNAKCLEQSKKQLPLDPYLLGLLLGDGGFTQMPSLTSEDKEVVDYVINWTKENDFTYRVDEKKDSKAVSLYITDKGRQGNRLIRLLEKLRLYGLKSEDKFIPEVYLYSSKEQRLELLRGLMDTDGFADKTHIEFYTSSKKLSKNTEYLIRSLGIGCRTTIKKTTHKDCYRTSLYTDLKVFNLERKQNRIGEKSKAGKSKYDKSYIIDIKPIGNRKGACIEVDNEDRTYITKDYIVTHNSYFWSLACAKYEICFNGVKYYTEENILNPPKAEVCVGAGQQNKSSEFCKKIQDSMMMLAKDVSLGTWGKPTEENYSPSPLYKEMAGTLLPNNKSKLWRHEYEVIDGGRKITEGSGSYVAHVVYSVQKTDGAEAAAGGRYNKLLYEEIGLLPLLIKAWGSNNSTVTVGKQFGCQIGLGTSGNMETVQPAKEIFTHPKQFNLVSFNDEWEESGDIGFFLPKYITDSRFKDENGNTDFDTAIDYYLEKEKVAAEADNPHVLAIFKMNNPMVPSDMWQTDRGYLLPVNEAESREKELLKNKLYMKTGTPVTLTWNSKMPREIQHEITKKKQPFYEHRYKYTRDTLDGPIMIYEFPQEFEGTIPKDMYIFTHDPYKSDNINEGDSLGCTYVLLNPKYIPYGYNGNTIVASYISKCSGGRREYYENLEKLLAFYGNPYRGLWFENNAGIGDECKNYFLNRNKGYVLNLRPQRVQTANVYQKSIIANYGYVIGNKISKVELLTKFAEWLLEPTELSDGVKTNIERVPCRFLIQQIQQFNLDTGNYDAAMSMLGFVIALKENEKELMEAGMKKTNPYAFLSQNPHMFKNPDPLHSLRKRHEELFKEEDKTAVNYRWDDRWNMDKT